MHTPTAAPRRTAWAGAALLAALVLGGCAADPDAGPTAEPEPTEVTLTAQADAAAKCAVPTAEVLRRQEVAFEGTVSEVADGTATLDVERWFTGGEGDTVTVATPSQQLQDLLLAVDFQEGRTYLVSATGGQVALCGFSAEKDDLLTRVYADAFGE